MKIYHFFALISRMKYIMRWGLKRNSIPENVQEHSHMTAVLAHALASIRRDVFGKTDVNPEVCATYALFHDASEIFTGDLPTPIKYFSPEIKSAYKDVEELSKEKLLTFLPDQLKSTYRSFIFEESDDVTRSIVKSADKLSAYIKCAEEMKLGNNEFKQATEDTFLALEKLESDELKYFMENFMPSFFLTLDEQE